MTAVRQLALVPLPPRPDRGRPLLAVQLPGKPQRAKHHPVVIGKGTPYVRATTRPDPGWDAWRSAMVTALRTWGRGRACIVAPVIAGVTAVFPRPKSPRTSYTLDGVTRPYPFPWHPGRVEYIGDPDHDQVTKAAIDVCKQAGLLGDDTLVVGYAGGESRFYAAEGESPCVEVRLWHA